MTDMKNVIEKIEEIQSILERDIEWPLTDYIDKKEITPFLTEIYANLMILKLNAENISDKERDKELGSDWVRKNLGYEVN